ncbi:hypothetical protein [Patulibacter defluvii]|uniref:hypothetical protein n=1 Tax=Patulibacter defluvii TaxID=3095358 RepID=UPI002A7569C7|nr:hypothetical protein [Patulibacter sp. DM4]
MSSAAKRPAGDPAPPANEVRRLDDRDARLPESRPFAQNLAIVVGAFAAVTLIAELAGAANLGTALSFGQIGFAIALVYVLVRR